MPDSHAIPGMGDVNGAIRRLCNGRIGELARIFFPRESRRPLSDVRHHSSRNFDRQRPTSVSWPNGEPDCHSSESLIGAAEPGATNSSGGSATAEAWQLGNGACA